MTTIGWVTLGFAALSVAMAIIFGLPALVKGLREKESTNVDKPVQSASKITVLSRGRRGHVVFISHSGDIDLGMGGSDPGQDESRSKIEKSYVVGSWRLNKSSSELVGHANGRGSA